MVHNCSITAMWFKYLIQYSSQVVVGSRLFYEADPGVSGFAADPVIHM